MDSVKIMKDSIEDYLDDMPHCVQQSVKHLAQVIGEIFEDDKDVIWATMMVIGHMHLRSRYPERINRFMEILTTNDEKNRMH